MSGVVWSANQNPSLGGYGYFVEPYIEKKKGKM